MCSSAFPHAVAGVAPGLLRGLRQAEVSPPPATRSLYARRAGADPSAQGRYAVGMYSRNIQMAPRALVFGASGQIGAALLPLLSAAGWQVLAVSRQPRVTDDGVHWLQADLHGAWSGPREFDAVFSCGPLDHFARWFGQSPLQTPRVIAFGSTSGVVKQDSEDPAERALAARLATAEQGLFAYAAAHACAATVLRPTLVWGAGQDRSLSRIAALATRCGLFVLPASATGLRQPVHVQDLARAALDVLSCDASHGRAYELGGGQVLGYDRMVARVLAVLPRPARLLRVPTPVFSAGVALAQRFGRLQGLGPAAVARMGDDLVFDNRPAQVDFGYAPRGFAPGAAELGLAQ